MLNLLNTLPVCVITQKESTQVSSESHHGILFAGTGSNSRRESMVSINAVI